MCAYLSCGVKFWKTASNAVASKNSLEPDGGREPPWLEVLSQGPPCPLTPSPLAVARPNHLSFQQHSRILRLSTFVFIHIQASPPSFPQRFFVFNNIPASFRQKRVLSEVHPTAKS